MRIRPLTIAIETLFGLGLTALIAGAIDTLAGGGGLITLPALMLAGLPPALALGTNKLQGVAGTATATWVLWRNQTLEFRSVWRWAMAAFLGSAIGTMMVQRLDASLLSIVIPIVLVIIATYFILIPTHKLLGGRSRLSNRLYQMLIIPGIGFYDGMFGPGTGSFFALVGVALKGQSLVQATAIAKCLNCATNLAALLVFLLAGKVVWWMGGTMIVGQLIGASFAARYLPKINPRLLKSLVVVICLAMLGRYINNQWHLVDPFFRNGAIER